MFINTIKVEFSAGEEADDISPSFFISRTLSKEDSTFTEINPASRIQEELTDLIQQERMRVQRQLEPLGKNVSEVGWKLTGLQDVPRRFFMQKPSAWLFEDDDVEEGVFLILDDGSQGKGKEKRNYIYTISESRNDASVLIEKLDESIREIADIVGRDYVILDNFIYGSSIVEEFLDSKEGVKTWTQTEAGNEFEETIHEEVREMIGTCLENVKVGLESGEETEYDMIVLPLGRHGEKFALEAKDFTKIQKEIEEEETESDLSASNLKGKLITQPNDSAGMLDLNLIMIVNGMEEETYDNLRVLAEQRNVHLLTQDNYSDRLEELLLQDNLEKFPSRGSVSGGSYITSTTLAEFDQWTYSK